MKTWIRDRRLSLLSQCQSTPIKLSNVIIHLKSQDIYITWQYLHIFNIGHNLFTKTQSYSRTLAHTHAFQAHHADPSTPPPPVLTGGLAVPAAGDPTSAGDSGHVPLTVIHSRPGHLRVVPGRRRRSAQPAADPTPLVRQLQSIVGSSVAQPMSYLGH